MYVTVCPTLHPMTWLRRGVARSAGLSQHGLMFRYGRDALHYGLDLLGLSRGDVVLLPASICDVVLRTLVKNGIGLRYYGLDAALRPDLDDIEAQISPDTKAIYANHYFGLPTDLSDLRNFCHRRGLALIEDCAHTLAGPGSPIGTHGDIALFSPRKLLPLPHGGMLVINNGRRADPASIPRADEAAALAAAFKLMAADFARQGLLPVASIKRWRGSVEGYLATTASVDAEDWEAPRRMARVCDFLARRCNLEDLAQRRRRHYDEWTRWCEQQAAVRAVAPTLPQYAIPFSFPLRVSNAASLIRAAARQGLYLEPTLTAPLHEVPGLKDPARRFPLLEELATQLVSLPIHQSLQPRQMRAMRTILANACRS